MTISQARAQELVARTASPLRPGLFAIMSEGEASELRALWLRTHGPISQRDVLIRLAKGLPVGA